MGGLVGLSYGDITVDNCTVVDTTIAGTYNLGGLIGLVIGENTVTVTDSATDVDFVLEDKYNGGMFATFRDGASIWMYISGTDVWYYAASADMYCYESTEEARNEYLAGLGMTVKGDHLDALVRND